MEITCPSGLVGRIRRIRGTELSALAEQSDGENSAESGIATIVGGCWEETVDAGPYPESIAPIGPGMRPNWKTMLKGDLAYALFRLRAASVETPDEPPGPWGIGDCYYFDVQCERCRVRYSWQLLLSDLRCVRLPETSQTILGDPAQSFRCEVGGHKYTFALQSAARDEPMGKLRKQQRRTTATMVDSLCAQTISVDGQALDIRRRWAHLEKLDMPMLQRLRQAYEAADCGIDTEVQTRCPECRWTQDIELPMGKGFFAPKSRPPLEPIEEADSSPSTPPSVAVSSGASASSGGDASSIT